MAVSLSISLAASAIETRAFRLLQQRHFIRNNLHYLPTLRRVLLSSQSDKIPKVVLLIANML